MLSLTSMVGAVVNQQVGYELVSMVGAVVDQQAQAAVISLIEGGCRCQRVADLRGADALAAQPWHAAQLPSPQHACRVCRADSA